ncbi:hypothetical protein LCGC14_0358840 [marine sediment metagenome]|uniref:Uncharacterized protein n=1 Tax=marine sediment metagenome TaxID=412755 RepID=A0A0F9TEF8_9ZZZZ
MYCSKHYNVPLDTAGQCWRCNQVSGLDYKDQPQCPPAKPGPANSDLTQCIHGQYFGKCTFGCILDSEVFPENKPEPKTYCLVCRKQICICPARPGPVRDLAVGEPAGECEDALTTKNLYLCKCGRITRDCGRYPDDYGTLGSEGGICCHDCGNEEFETVKSIIDTLRTQLAKAEEELKDELTCEECENNFNDPDTGVTAFCVPCWNKMMTKLAAHRWIPVSKMPENFMQPHPPQDCELTEKYHALKYEAKIPEIATAAQIWFDEGSEYEYWKPITLPTGE